MDIAAQTHLHDTMPAGQRAWRLATGSLSIAVGAFLLATSSEYAMPTVTGVSMASAGLWSAGSVVLGRFAASTPKNLARG